MLIPPTRNIRFPIPYYPYIERRRTSRVSSLCLCLCLSVCLSLSSVGIVRAMKIYDEYVDSMWELSMRHLNKMPKTTTLLPQSCPHSAEIQHTGTHSHVSQSVEPKSCLHKRPNQSNSYIHWKNDSLSDRLSRFFLEGWEDVMALNPFPPASIEVQRTFRGSSLSQSLPQQSVGDEVLWHIICGLSVSWICVIGLKCFESQLSTESFTVTIRVALTLHDPVHIQPKFHTPGLTHTSPNPSNQKLQTVEPESPRYQSSAAIPMAPHS